MWEYKKKIKNMNKEYVATYNHNVYKNRLTWKIISVQGNVIKRSLL